jgi:hypothetical protein
MPEAAFVKQVMEYGALWAFAIFVCFVFWKKVVPLGDRYMTSVEKLHDSIGDHMKEQQRLCDGHGNIIIGHDKAARSAALEACKFCRAFVAKEFPTSTAEANSACDSIERIIGEV